MSHQLARRWFTVGQYNRMAEVGILTEEERVELIEGQIVKLSPIGSRHAACVNRCTRLLHLQAQQLFIVSVQDPIVLDDYSEPQPDLAVLRWRADYYEQALPEAADVLLVIELADTTAGADRNVKVPLYARSGIPATMLIDLPADLVEVHEQPVNGQYQSVQVFKRGDDVRLAALPQLSLGVDAVLG